jgi:O-acetyl-ADP-ribose deacetylase (regulator of RNase III)
MMPHDKIRIIKGDITKIDVDVIVNAANSGLMGGGGVDGAIHRAAGGSVLEECMEIVRELGECKTGDAVITNAGKLKCKKIIHTVGPVWHGGRSNEGQLLSSCYKRCLELAKLNGLKKIAFPNISTGVYGYPKLDAARIALKTVFEYLETDDFIEMVVFVCFDDENFAIYESEMKKKN